MPRAAIYTRVSSSHQVDSHSLKAQESACRAYADANNYEVVNVYTDRGESARTAERTAFQVMLNDAHRDFDVVIVHKVDRFARNVRDLLRIIDELDAVNTRVISVLDGEDYSTPGGRLHLSIMASVAEWGSRNLAQETTKGQREAAFSGILTSKPPLGYGRGDDGRLVPDENAQVVRKIFDLYLQVDSVNALVRQLKRQNINNPGTESGIWYAATIAYMLRNRTYIGEITYNDIITPAAHEPIIDLDTFNAVQKLIEKRTSYLHRHRRRHGVFPFSQVLRCNCGGEHYYTGQTASGGRYIRREPCQRPRSISIKSVEYQFERYILPLLNVSRALKQDVLALIDAPADGLTQSEAAAAKKRLQDLYVWGNIDQSEYELRLQEIDEKIAKPRATKQYLPVMELLEDFRRIWYAATPREQRDLIQLLFEGIYLENNQIVAIRPEPITFDLLSIEKQSSLFIHAQNIEIYKPRGIVA